MDHLYLHLYQKSIKNNITTFSIIDNDPRYDESTNIKNKSRSKAKIIDNLNDYKKNF